MKKCCTSAPLFWKSKERAWNPQGSGLVSGHALGRRSWTGDSFQYDLATGIALKKELLGFDSALCGYLLI
ncbi:hypothetical protein CO661_23745 [Sinorhizobium fredii]|uniref:Uncharacterized protein n=1 Tax=Rhizobium fredii TaxID=380 RepID=A0A2A6LS68_RHIFR|nr:hypothetical protein [Sinorhizobium fredii]MQX06997.1 hypothetical protein [Sinorhizobium fredii]PDT45503.1 hypothetical protein CO661_23745 [Sinorhizobium fredii]UTY50290.1 hypothetical protein EPK84_27795 [Sinorhizobium fredii]